MTTAKGVSMSIRIVRTLLLGVLLGCLPAMAAAQKADLTLLHINDVYEIAPKHGKGGLAQLMTLLKQERAQAVHHLTTFGGDLLSPSVMSGLKKGAQMIELMNAIGMDVASFGNHEFDFGADVLKQRIAESNFTWLATNSLGPDGRPFGGASSTVIRHIGELTIGFFAILTPETAHLSNPGPGVTFAPVQQTATAAVRALRREGVDVIIALTHLHMSRDRLLARQVPGIDAVLGGHDHDPILYFENGKLILKAGYDAHYLAVVDLHIEKTNTGSGATVSVLPQWRFLSTSGVVPDADIARLVDKHENELDRSLRVTVGKTAVTLDSRRAVVRTRESTVGNLITDAMRTAVGAEVAFINGGGIRGDRTYEAGTGLTRKDVLTELPFGNVTVMLELSGADLWAALEHGVSGVEDKAGRFLQVSGLTFRYDPQRPAGSRVVEVSIGGQPLRTTRAYTVAANDYIARGGDGFQVLKQAKVIIDVSGGSLMASQVMDYIATRGTVAPRVEGRIIARETGN